MKKLRRLNEIDLARIASMSPVDRRKALEQIKHFPPPFSYKPFRLQLNEIFNVQFGMFGGKERTEWATIEDFLNKKCDSENGLEANLRVAKGLYGFAAEKNIIGRDRKFFPMAMGAWGKFTYWHNMILIIGDHPTVLFVDPRQTCKLGKIGRKFVFSMMHERIRALDPDYADLRLMIVQFDRVIGDYRRPICHTDDGVKLFSLEEMEEMVDEIHKLWRDICEERDTSTRRKAAGIRGDLI